MAPISCEVSSSPTGPFEFRGSAARGEAWRTFRDERGDATDTLKYGVNPETDKGEVRRAVGPKALAAATGAAPTQIPLNKELELNDGQSGTIVVKHDGHPTYVRFTYTADP